jgi:hypothetical protein
MILHKGNIRLLLDLLLKRDLVGDLQVILDIKRTVSGLTLPIRWFELFVCTSLYLKNELMFLNIFTAQL